MYPALARFLPLVGIFVIDQRQPITTTTRASYPVALLNKSARGSSGSMVSSSFIKLRTRSSVGFGTTTWISTYSSPRTPSRALGTPFSRSRSVVPLLVAGGMRMSERPSIVGTSIFAPRVASLILTGTFTCKSFPCRSKNGCGLTSTRKYKSPVGAPIVPALPLPGTRTRDPLATPAGMRTSMVSVRLTRPSPPHVLHMVRSLPVPPQRVHGTLKRILPAACWIVPVPPHVGQVCGEPTAPVPWQVSQVSRRVIEIFFTAPRTASQKSISLWYSRSPPGSCSTSISAPRPPRKNWLNRSRKLDPLVPPTLPGLPALELKSNPPKSKLTRASSGSLPGGGPPGW